MVHYRANVNHFATECFKHFDNEKKMFDWISERIGEKVSSINECEEWTRKQEYDVAHTKGYINILTLNDLKDFFVWRKAYVTSIEKYNDFMFKASKTENVRRRADLLFDYGTQYDNANEYTKWCPAIWQGEI